MGAAPAARPALPDRGTALTRATRRHTSYDGLLDAAGGDPFVRWGLDPSAPVEGYSVDGAAGWVRTGPGRPGPWLTGVGHPLAVAHLVDAVLADGRSARPAGLTVPRGSPEAITGRIDGVLRGGADWDWLCTEVVPDPVPGEDRVADLGPHRWDDVRQLLDVASPRAAVRPGDAEALSWHGVDAVDGVLVACGARTDRVRDVAHLSSIATRPDQRGRGLGAAVTAALTRRALAEGAVVVTLGMYADNDVARRLYRRLGFRDEHRFSSRLLVGRTAGGTAGGTAEGPAGG